MPAIKYKKKTYASGTFPVMELTRAAYNALPDAKKMDGTVYMITDDDCGWDWLAERCTYDNTTSGLTATNIQDALDEIAAYAKSTSGSNYCKMADGTLMEWGLASVTTGSGKGPLGYIGSAVVQFSPAFASAPVVTVAANENGGYWSASAYSASASQVTVYIAGDQQNVTRKVHWHAIGRWK